MVRLLRFDSDYMEGAHPEILRRLSEINFEKNPGYGSDDYCKSAADRIRAACGCPDARVYFLPGGTQTNATVTDALLKGYQGVVSATSGHINQSEAGAVEAYGHKIITIPEKDGKIPAEDLREYLDAFFGDSGRSHMVEPGMVYISHPTEYGTVYTLSELETLSGICRSRGIPLYLDGARLGYGLVAEGSDVTLEDIARLCSVFYIGGTKVGALFGEAVVFPDPAYDDHFFTYAKRHGGITAKGWILGLQFDTLFTDGLYLSISRSAVSLAAELKKGLKEKGYSMLTDSPTNQQFVIVEKSKLRELEGLLTYSYWDPYDESRSVIRLATSWATTKAQVEELLELF
jgi:threonine aldolase